MSSVATINHKARKRAMEAHFRRNGLPLNDEALRRAFIAAWQAGRKFERLQYEIVPDELPRYDRSTFAVTAA